MNDPTTVADIQSKKQSRKKWGVLLLRWFFGGIVGSVGSLFPLGLTLVMGPVSIIGLIFLGQYGLCRKIVSSMIDPFLYYDINLLYILNVMFSLFMYSIFWGLIGALLASGRKKQIIGGIILLILYVVAGYWSLIIYGSRIFND